MKEKEMNDPLLNDRVVKKLFLNGSEESREYFLLITSLATGIPVENLKEDFALIHPEISLNKNIVNSEADIAFENKGCIISFEVNYRNKKNYEMKNTSYIFELYLRQIRSYKDYENLKKVYQVNLDYFDEYKKGEFLYITELMETKYHIPREEGLRIIDINLDYLRKKGYNTIRKDEVLERLLYLFVCSDKKVLDELYKGDKLMKEVRKEADRIVKDLDLLLYYDKDKMDQEYAYETGEENGRKEGKREEKLEIAKKMLEKYDIKEITKITGLTEEEILELKEK